VLPPRKDDPTSRLALEDLISSSRSVAIVGPIMVVIECLNLVVRELSESRGCSCYLRRVYERDINFERHTSGVSIYCAAERRFAPHSLDGRGKFRREDVGRSEERWPLSRRSTTYAHREGQ
jgi:hypothetical protein